MARKALIDTATGYVKNVIEADDDFAAPDGCTLMESDTAGPGDTWDGTVFIKALPPTDPLLRVRTILNKADADVTAAELKEAAMRGLRYLIMGR